MSCWREHSSFSSINRIRIKQGDGCKRKHRSEQALSSNSDPEPEDPVFIATDDHNDDDDIQYIFCGASFSQDKYGERWVQYSQREIWGHRDCAENIENNSICNMFLNG